MELLFALNTCFSKFTFLRTFRSSFFNFPFFNFYFFRNFKIPFFTFLNSKPLMQVSSLLLLLCYVILYNYMVCVGDVCWNRCSYVFARKALQQVTVKPRLARGKNVITPLEPPELQCYTTPLLMHIK